MSRRPERRYRPQQLPPRRPPALRVADSDRRLGDFWSLEMGRSRARSPLRAARSDPIGLLSGVVIVLGVFPHPEPPGRPCGRGTRVFQRPGCCRPFRSHSHDTITDLPAGEKLDSVQLPEVDLVRSKRAIRGTCTSSACAGCLRRGRPALGASRAWEPLVYDLDERRLNPQPNGRLS
jgi:hypothetical protein